MNILLTTFGLTWQIVPEIVGLTNPLDVPLYTHYPAKHHLLNFREMAGNEPVDEVWLILTNDPKSIEAYKKVEEWFGLLQNPHFKLQKLTCQATQQLADATECRIMSDYILRMVLMAKEATKGGNLLLSLAGGRKTMSADLQRAAYVFGCKLLFHVADNLTPSALLRNSKLPALALTESLVEDEIKMVFPVIVSQNLQASVTSVLPQQLKSTDYPQNYYNDELLMEIEQRESESQNLLHNAYFQRRQHNSASYFHGLQLLPPNLIHNLENESIGVNHSEKENDLAWLKNLPKADLHCHLGGVLDIKGLLGAANANVTDISQALNTSKELDEWFKLVKEAVKQHDAGFFAKWNDDWKKLRGIFPQFPNSTVISTFISAFNNDPDFLDEIVFGNYCHEKNYQGVGIEKYEALGDLQGSALLGSEACLRFALRYLVEKCIGEHVTYCEVRCSPAKYAVGSMSITRVVDVIREELAMSQSTLFKLIIIASRHGSEAELHQHIQLVGTLSTQADFDQWYAGFDLAGNEAIISPGQLREAFDPLMQDCVNITIHAGENAPVQNIWEAVYRLNADRIGHGLTLRDNLKLLKRFANNRIVLEMCPSSNFQIVGYQDFCNEFNQNTKVYPLKEYITQNLVVTINTDNRGISRTSLSNEYLKAAQMTPNGLTKWEILQLIRNGYKSAFVSHIQKKQLLVKAEEQILNLLIHE